MNHLHQRPSTNAHPPADLREFLQTLKAKQPSEILGSAAEGHLGRALIQATIGCLLLLAVLTVGPYLLSKNAPAGGQESIARAEKETSSETGNQAKQPETATPAGQKIGPTAKPADAKEPATPATIADKLQENKTKKGTPKDPFGTDLNDLLDK